MPAHNTFHPFVHQLDHALKNPARTQNNQPPIIRVSHPFTDTSTHLAHVPVLLSDVVQGGTGEAAALEFERKPGLRVGRGDAQNRDIK